MATGEWRVVGRVAALSRYPVKSMRGERLDKTDLRWSGFQGDREYAFVRDDRLRRFPWLTGRELPEMLLYAAAAQDGHASAGPPVAVTTPDGRELSVEDPALTAELTSRAGYPIRPMQLSRGAYDSMPLSIMSTATLRALDAERATPIEAERFRMNVLVEAAERDRDWRGSVLRFGRDGPRVAVTRPVERCAMITIDPTTARRDPSLMRTVAQRFGNEVGEYASVLREGELLVGDEVSLSPFPA